MRAYKQAGIRADYIQKHHPHVRTLVVGMLTICIYADIRYIRVGTDAYAQRHMHTHILAEGQAGIHRYTIILTLPQT